MVGCYAVANFRSIIIMIKSVTRRFNCNAREIALSTCYGYSISLSQCHCKDVYIYIIVRNVQYSGVLRNVKQYAKHNV